MESNPTCLKGAQQVTGVEQASCKRRRVGLLQTIEKGHRPGPEKSLGERMRTQGGQIASFLFRIQGQGFLCELCQVAKHCEAHEHNRRCDPARTHQFAPHDSIDLNYSFDRQVLVPTLCPHSARHGDKQ